MSDDDWDTDPDFTNDLTEVEKRAYGNRETMEKHQAATGGHGAAFGAESGALSAPAPPPPKMGEVLSGQIGGGPTPAPAAQYTAPTRVEYAQPQMPPKVPSLVKESHMAAASSAKPAASSMVPARRPSKGSVFDRPKNLSDAEVQELRAVFTAFDTDQSGRISVEELSNAMQQMELPVERGKLVALMGEADTNGDQHIDFGEFLTVVERTKAGDSSVKGKATQGLNPGLAHPTQVNHSHVRVLPWTGLGDAIKKKSTVLQIKKDATVHSFAEEACMAFEPETETETEAEPRPGPDPGPGSGPGPEP